MRCLLLQRALEPGEVGHRAAHRGQGEPALRGHRRERDARRTTRRSREPPSDALTLLGRRVHPDARLVGPREELAAQRPDRILVAQGETPDETIDDGRPADAVEHEVGCGLVGLDDHGVERGAQRPRGAVGLQRRRVRAAVGAGEVPAVELAERDGVVEPETAPRDLLRCGEEDQHLARGRQRHRPTRLHRGEHRAVLVEHDERRASRMLTDPDQQRSGRGGRGVRGGRRERVRAGQAESAGCSGGEGGATSQVHETSRTIVLSTICRRRPGTRRPRATRAGRALGAGDAVALCSTHRSEPSACTSRHGAMRPAGIA